MSIESQTQKIQQKKFQNPVFFYMGLSLLLDIVQIAGLLR
jgi:hypothetical protein